MLAWGLLLLSLTIELNCLLLSRKLKKTIIHVHSTDLSPLEMCGVAVLASEEEKLHGKNTTCSQGTCRPTGETDTYAHQCYPRAVMF